VIKEVYKRAEGLGLGRSVIKPGKMARTGSVWPDNKEK
jgi:hypothetical protein